MCNLIKCANKKCDGHRQTDYKVIPTCQSTYLGDTKTLCVHAELVNTYSKRKLNCAINLDIYILAPNI